MPWWAGLLTRGLDLLITLLETVGARGVRWEWKKRAWRQALASRIAGWENLVAFLEAR